jgi:peptidoglycan-N-acetylglucosamine deacetylase
MQRRVISRPLLLAAALLFVMPLLAGAQEPGPQGKKSGSKQIAITFDELPAAMTFGDVDAQAINYMILETLRKHGVKATGFVVGLNVNGQYDLLGEWLNEGHTLGTMTATNQDIDGLNAKGFMQEIYSGESEIAAMLDGFGQKGRFFRYPFLHYGSDPATKETIREYLSGRDIIVGHASVAPDDFAYDMALQKFGKVPDSAQYNRLLNEYVNYVLDQIVRSEQLAKELVGHPVKQILRLRANRLNAIYLDEMLKAIEGEGYSYVSLATALRDPIYAEPENYLGTRGVGYLDMIYASRAKAKP